MSLKNLRGLDFITPKKESGYFLSNNIFPTIKKNHFSILDDFAVDGAAPKQVIRLYRYKKGTKQKGTKLPIYIAKTGHKWYPNESVTEQLFTDIGNCFKLNMAETFLAIFTRQIKFLSKYFLQKNDKLVKGVEIYSNFCDVDKNFIDEIEEQNFSQELLTVRYTYKALKNNYIENYQKIFNEYTRMLIFDAIVGNNDRHTYNWGVIRIIKKNKDKYMFSPIYDTARGLFWNIPEKQLKQYANEQKLEKYISNCKSKTSFDGIKNENHFDLVEKIYKNKKILELEESLFTDLINERLFENTINMLDNKYGSILSEVRLNRIKECLRQRFYKIYNLIQKQK